jgi:hypothetical protein
LVGSPAKIDDFCRIVLCSPALENASLMLLFQLLAECRFIRSQFRESDIWECLTLEQIVLHNQVKKAGASI